ncbi:hypothetical protein VitviT2T_000185 [Vitis vinifera]|uniref:DUF2232 domain-containing protein n=2 Tax=Vitis vinifera TaxID=29760 RepID=A0ABY9BC20_VITVI|nr:uncharacterized protein LOC100256033 isoform X1 [Vitis vinifera]WJZ80251.1 hypothetical protein VitviT2T_000185 [Vitis vinifera]|eukprot:XP_002279949.1 PREDICTED: uncharacterized protein LOC100256033 [Vitis vinifera]
MNLLKIHNRQPSYFLNSHTAPLSPPRFLSLPCFRPTPSLPPFPSLSLHKYKFPISRVSGTKPSRWTNEEKEEEFEDLAPNSVVYQKTLRLVECSMFAAVAGLAYFLSNSLAIENYFGCFFSLPIVLSSMRWGVAAGRKTMVATTMLLFVLSGPVKASTYLLLHGLVGLTMGSLWRLGANWGLSICLCTFVRAMGAMGYVLISSFLIRENILALITLNVHASITYMFTAIGVNTIPSMDLIYALFGTLLLLNSGFFVFLLHILYAVFLSRLGMKASLTMPRWLEKAI